VHTVYCELTHLNANSVGYPDIEDSLEREMNQELAAYSSYFIKPPGAGIY